MALKVGDLRKALEGVEDDLEVVVNANYQYTYWLADKTSTEYVDEEDDGVLLDEQEFQKADAEYQQELKRVFVVLTI